MRKTTDLFLTFMEVGAFTFGGGYAMLSLLDHTCVEKKRWITADEMMDLAVIAESTPGPIAINCATYTGYKVAGMAGAVSATVGIVLPSFLLLCFLSSFFEDVLAVPFVANAFRGIRLAVSLLITQAAVKMLRKMWGRSAQKYRQATVAALAFLVTLAASAAAVHLSTIYVILAGGLVGLLLFYGRRDKG